MSNYTTQSNSHPQSTGSGHKNTGNSGNSGTIRASMSSGTPTPKKTIQKSGK